MDLYAADTASTLLHVAARLGGLVIIAPIYSSRSVPARIRAGLVIVLAVLLQPAASAAGGGVALSLASVLGEALIGFAIGFGAAVFVGAAEAAGNYLAVHTGLAGATVLDPTSGGRTGVLGQLLRLFAVTMLLASDGHLLMLDALAESLHFLPAGNPLHLDAGLASMVSLGTTLFALGFRFAAPVVVAVLLAAVALAILTRAAPQINVLAVAFPLQIGVGLLALAAAMPVLGTLFSGWDSQYDAVLTRMLMALAGSGT